MNQALDLEPACEHCAAHFFLRICGQCTICLEQENSILYVVSEKLLKPSTQKNLYMQSQNFEVKNGIDRLHGPRLIINRLRLSKCMVAA